MSVAWRTAGEQMHAAFRPIMGFMGGVGNLVGFTALTAAIGAAFEVPHLLAEGSEAAGW